MSVESHAVVGIVSGVVGFVGGIAVGATVVNAINEIEKKSLAGQLDGIDTKLAEEVISLYKDPQSQFGNTYSILDSIKNCLDDDKTGLKGLGDEVINYINQTCFPKMLQGSHQDYSKIPNLRTGLKNSSDDPLKTRTATYEYFDDYYSQKYKETKSKADRYIAEVRVLDNIHSVILAYIDIIKTQPGKESAKILTHLGNALNILHENFKKIIGPERDISFLNIFGKTRRENLGKKLEEEDHKILQDAISGQSQISLVSSCEQSMTNTIDLINAINKVFFKIDPLAYGTKREINLEKMANKEIERTVSGNNMLSCYPTADVIAHHSANTIKLRRKKSTDFYNSFNERFENGNFDLSSEIDKKEHGFLDKINQNLYLINNEDLDKISKIMNYFNIIYALEEDLKNKIDTYGSQGIIATGEFEFRRTLIETFYHQARIEFEQFFINNPTYKKILESAEQASRLGTQPIDTKLEKYFPNKKRLPNISFLNDLKDIESKADQLEKTRQHIDDYVSDRQKISGSIIHPIILNSDEFIINMALICANDSKLKEKIYNNLAVAGKDLNEKHNKIFNGKLELFNTKMNKFIKIKNNIDNIRELIVKLTKHNKELRIKYLNIINFSNFQNKVSFDKMNNLIKQNLEQKNSENISLLNEYGFTARIGDLNNDIVEYQERYKSISPNHDRLISAEKTNDTLKNENLHLKKQYDKEIFDKSQALEAAEIQYKEQIKSERELHQQIITDKDNLFNNIETEHLLARKSLQIELDSKTKENELLNYQLQIQKAANSETETKYHALEEAHEITKILNTSLITQVSETEKLTIKLIDKYANIIFQLAADMEKIKNSAKAVITQAQLNRDDINASRQTKAEAEKIQKDADTAIASLNTEIQNMERELSSLADDIPKDSQFLKAKFVQIQEDLIKQKNSIAESDKMIAQLKDQIKFLTTQIEKMEKEIERDREKAAKESEMNKQLLLEHKTQRENSEKQLKETELKLAALEKANSDPVGYLLDTLQISKNLNKKARITELLMNPDKIKTLYDHHEYLNKTILKISNTKNYNQNKGFNIAINLFEKDRFIESLMKYIGNTFSDSDLAICFKTLGNGGEKNYDAILDLSSLLRVYKDCLKNSHKAVSKDAYKEVDSKKDPGIFSHKTWLRTYQYLSTDNSSNYVSRTKNTRTAKLINDNISHTLFAPATTLNPNNNHLNKANSAYLSTLQREPSSISVTTLNRGI